MASKVDLNQTQGRSPAARAACLLNFHRLKREGGSVALQAVEDCTCAKGCTDLEREQITHVIPSKCIQTL